MSTMAPKTGVYHALPEYDDSESGLTAIVTGASGISGEYMLRHLASFPTRWSKIYALSRSPPRGFSAPNVEHVPIDLLAGVDKIEEKLKERNVEADVVFFFAYTEVQDESSGLWGAQGKMCEVNGQMLRDFIVAMKDRQFEKIVLQTGAKQYGIHIGPTLLPCEEDDPRVSTLPNFYYTQEDILKELAPKQKFTYSVTRPSHILGAVTGNYMNLAIALGLYFVVQKELGEHAVFPGTAYKWNCFESFSGATLNSCLAEFCALTPSCAGEAFNAVNGDVTSWARIYPRLASYWDATLPPPSEHFTSPAQRPFKFISDSPAPIDPTIKPVMELRNSLQEWSKDSKVLEAWDRLARREELDKEVFGKASWGFADAVLALQWTFILSPNKLRKFGYHASVDSLDDFIKVWEEAQRLGLLPTVWKKK